MVISQIFWFLITHLNISEFNLLASSSAAPSNPQGALPAYLFSIPEPTSPLPTSSPEKGTTTATPSPQKRPAPTESQSGSSSTKRRKTRGAKSSPLVLNLDEDEPMPEPLAGPSGNQPEIPEKDVQDIDETRPENPGSLIAADPVAEEKPENPSLITANPVAVTPPSFIGLTDAEISNLGAAKEGPLITANQISDLDFLNPDAIANYSWLKFGTIPNVSRVSEYVSIPAKDPDDLEAVTLTWLTNHIASREIKQFLIHPDLENPVEFTPAMLPSPESQISPGSSVHPPFRKTRQGTTKTVTEATPPPAVPWASIKLPSDTKKQVKKNIRNVFLQFIGECKISVTGNEISLILSRKLHFPMQILRRRNFSNLARSWKKTDIQLSMHQGNVCLGSHLNMLWRGVWMP
jgi:hypothetical protein